MFPSEELCAAQRHVGQRLLLVNPHLTFRLRVVLCCVVLCCVSSRRRRSSSRHSTPYLHWCVCRCSRVQWMRRILTSTRCAYTGTVHWDRQYLPIYLIESYVWRSNVLGGVMRKPRRSFRLPLRPLNLSMFQQVREPPWACHGTCVIGRPWCDIVQSPYTLRRHPPLL